ncbi:MAG: SufD family Fe-S cluster assembly protein, partial [Desulfamplus sp.]|nr:SufD family Fe-S cluster assembly protein [Desulfamplus sp.]
MSKNDVNFSKYINLSEDHGYVDNLGAIEQNDVKEFVRVGIDTDNSLRAATFIQKDSSIIHCSKSIEGVEIKGISQALKQYEWLNDYLWKLVPHEKDEITRALS